MATEKEIGACVKIVSGLEPSVLAGGINMTEIGLIKASLSPQNARILNALYPERSNGTVSHTVVSGKTIPTVKIEWRKPAAANELKDSPSCSATGQLSTKWEDTYLINKYLEDGFSINEASINMICDELDQMNGTYAATRGINSPVSGIFKNTINGELTDKIRNILVGVEAVAADTLVAGIGVNKLYGTADPQDVKLFNMDDPQQGPLRFFKQELVNLTRKNKMQGRPIIITDSTDVLNWFELMCGSVCCSDAGVDYSKLINQQYEVYFSDKLSEAIGGDDEGGNIIVCYPETFVMLAVDKWRNVQLATGSSKMANTEIGKISIVEPSMRISDANCIAQGINPRMTFDFRVKEVDCADDAFLPSVTFLPSLQYNFVTAPADADGTTGIFHYKVDNGVTP